MTLPTGLIPGPPSLNPLVMTNLINQWIVALQSSFESPTEPPSPIDGQLWLDTSNMTIGKVLKVRVDGTWYPVHTGIATPVQTNLNLAVVTGIYSFVPAVLNVPFPAVGTLIVTASANTVSQLAMRQGLSEFNLLSVRISPDAGSTWTPWRRVYTQADIVGTVTRASGIPTGAIIESQTLSSGYYVRLADGTQWCTAERTLTYTNGGQLDNVWNVPREFINSNVAVAVTPGAMNIAGNAAMLAAARGFAQSSSQIMLSIRRVSGLTDFVPGNTIAASVIAIGRWAA